MGSKPVPLFEPQLHNAPLEHCAACLGTAERRAARRQTHIVRRAARAIRDRDLIMQKMNKARPNNNAKSNYIYFVFPVRASIRYVKKMI